MPCFFPSIDFDAQLEVMKQWSKHVDGSYLYYWIGLHSGEPTHWQDLAVYDRLTQIVNCKAEAMGAEIVGWSPADALQLYFLAHKAWDVDFDVGAAQAEYFDESFGPAAGTMKKYCRLVQRIHRDPQSRDVYGQYHQHAIERANSLLNEASHAVAGLEPAYRHRIDRASVFFKANSDLFRCRALTTAYCETREEADRERAAQAIANALALIDSVKSRNILWTDRFNGAPYYLYPYMQSVVTGPPKTRFKSRGEFTYQYSGELIFALYQDLRGALTLADAVEAENVIAGKKSSLVKPNSIGELVYEFLSPPNTVFDRVNLRPCPYLALTRPETDVLQHGKKNEELASTGLAGFSVEISTDGGHQWNLLTDKTSESDNPFDITEMVKGKDAFAIRYRGENQSDQPQPFVDLPKLTGLIADGTASTPSARFWKRWDEGPLQMPAPGFKPDLAENTPIPLPKTFQLSDVDLELAYLYWSGYHQATDFYDGKGVGDDSCIRIWENEGPGWSGVAGIPVEPGAKYKLTFYIQVTRGKAQVSAITGDRLLLPQEPGWDEIAVTEPQTFEPGESFQRSELEITIPKTLKPDQSQLKIVFVHKGTGAEFFVDDIILQRIAP